jgi:hypothetical protein
MAKAKKKQVYVFEIEVTEPDPEFGEDEDFNFFVPESLGKVHKILTSLRDASEMCAIRGGAWYFLHGGEAILVDSIPDLSAREGEIIQAIKDSKDDGDMIWLQFACVDMDGDEHWSSGFMELSENPGFKMLVVYGTHPDFGPNVLQKYSDGEFDTGIESERDPDAYTVQPEWEKKIGDKHLLEFLDASFYK